MRLNKNSSYLVLGYSIIIIVIYLNLIFRIIFKFNQTNFNFLSDMDFGSIISWLKKPGIISFNQESSRYSRYFVLYSKIAFCLKALTWTDRYSRNLNFLSILIVINLHILIRIIFKLKETRNRISVSFWALFLSIFSIFFISISFYMYRMLFIYIYIQIIFRRYIALLYRLNLWFHPVNDACCMIIIISVFWWEMIQYPSIVA